MPDFAKLAAACTIARGLAMDAVHACSSGHLGLPLGATEVGAVLYGELLRHDPADPHWINRDRFVLSAGPREHVPLRAGSTSRATRSRSTK